MHLSTKQSITQTFLRCCHFSTLAFSRDAILSSSNFSLQFQDDIGVSGVIGSAVFNITLVIAVCALAAERVLYLNWYSVVRDCTCYLISIIVLLFTIANSIVSW